MADYDPFDLSLAAKKLREEQEAAKQKAKPVPKPKATVRRVGIGPILHSRFTKVITLVLAVVLMALIGFIGTKYYLEVYR